MLGCLGAEISPVRAALAGTLPAGCSARPGWGWEELLGFPPRSMAASAHQAITAHVEQGSGMFSSLQTSILMQALMDTPFLHGNGKTGRCSHREWEEKILNPSSYPCMHWGRTSCNSESALLCTMFGTREFIYIFYMLYAFMQFS